MKAPTISVVRVELLHPRCTRKSAAESLLINAAGYNGGVITGREGGSRGSFHEEPEENVNR